MSLQLTLSLLLSRKLSSEFYTISSTSLLWKLVLPLLCPQYHSWVKSWTKCTEWKRAGRIPAITERLLIATRNERLNYSLPIYRRKWHMISVLTSSQQQKWSPCSARVSDEENISNYLTQYSIYESFSNRRRNLRL